MNENLRVENKNNLYRVNGTLGNEITPTLSDLIVQYYSENGKKLSSSYENYSHVSGHMENDNGEVTGDYYLRVFIKEKDKINMFTEVTHSTVKSVETLPNGRIDRTEVYYDTVNEKQTMVDFTIYYENGQTYSLHVQPDSNRPEIIAQMFQYLTDEKVYE